MPNFYLHPQGICETQSVGAGTKIWAFAHVLPGAIIGSNCNICDHVFIENDVAIGNNVTIKCGVQIWDGITVEDDVFIGPNATFSNDRYPKSKRRPSTFLKTILRRGSSVGANATILPGLEIGQGSLIGAGAVVTRNVPPNAIVAGNPARISGYIESDDHGNPKPSIEITSTSSSVVAIGVGKATLHFMPQVGDMRGDLSVGEFGADVPFVAQRYFVVFDVPTREVRGEHAHKQCHQFLICVKGSCRILLDDGASRQEILLNRPNIGVYIPPMIWGSQFDHAPGSVLLVFASDTYDSDDYIRDYYSFLSETKFTTAR